MIYHRSTLKPVLIGIEVAIAYVMHKTRFVFPIIGGRKVEHLEANIEALEISLTPEHVAFLDSVLPFDLGFPHSMIVRTLLGPISLPPLTLASHRAMAPSPCGSTTPQGTSTFGPLLNPSLARNWASEQAYDRDV